MSAVPVSPFLLVGDPAAAACEGDFCPAPAVQDATTEDQEPALSPVPQAPAHLVVESLGA